MSKLHNDIPRMIRGIKIIEQYNNYKQLGAEEDIIFLREKVNTLNDIKNMQELVKEFYWCTKMINMYLDEIEPEFKFHILQEERKKLKDEFE
jgi:hypothetical protein